VRVRDRLVIALLLTFVVAGGMWLLLVTPERTQVSSLATQIATQRAALATAETQALAARRAVTGYVGHLHQIDQVMRAVPLVPAEAEVVATIDKLTGQKVQPDFREIDVGANGASAAGPVALDLTFTFWATYHGLQDFFTALDNLTATDGLSVNASGRLFTINSVALTPLQQAGVPSDVLRVAISAQAYLQSDTTAAAATTTTPATGATTG
jgi:Tfp pilus assembly protein PilO